LPTWGLVLMLTPALCLLLFVLLLPFWQLKVLNMVVTLVAMLGSIGAFFVLQVSGAHSSEVHRTQALEHCMP